MKPQAGTSRATTAAAHARADAAAHIAAALLLAAALATLVALFSGADWLEAALPGGLPLGNVLAALALCAPAATAALIARHGSLARGVAVAVLVLGLAWMPVSLLLAGNPELNFAGGRGGIWLALSLALAVCSYGVLAWCLAAATLRAWRGWQVRRAARRLRSASNSRTPSGRRDTA